MYVKEQSDLDGGFISCPPCVPPDARGSLTTEQLLGFLSKNNKRPVLKHSRKPMILPPILDTWYVAQRVVPIMCGRKHTCVQGTSTPDRKSATFKFSAEPYRRKTWLTGKEGTAVPQILMSPVVPQLCHGCCSLLVCFVDYSVCIGRQSSYVSGSAGFVIWMYITRGL